MIQSKSRSKRVQSGLATVEFAVTLPFLLLVIAISGEIGYVMYQQTLLSKTIETGGRYISVNATSGTGLVDISAQDLLDTRNVILYGNKAGIGQPIISDLSPLNINVTCTYGTQNGHCVKNWNVTPITVQANFTYTPVLGDLFDNVTGFNLFPVPLSAITIVESI